MEHYYAGGISSVRGFKQNTQSPRAIPSQFYLDNEGNPITGDDGNPILNPYITGMIDLLGAYLIEGGFDFIFKLLSKIKINEKFIFVDIGNVFSKDCGIDQSNINCSELDLANYVIHKALVSLGLLNLALCP